MPLKIHIILSAMIVVGTLAKSRCIGGQTENVPSKLLVLSSSNFLTLSITNGVTH
jgi:hypothetical protein